MFFFRVFFIITVLHHLSLATWALLVLLGCGLRFAEFEFVFVFALFWFFSAFFVFSCQ